VRSESDIEPFTSRLRDPARARAGSELYRGLVLREFQSMLRGAYDDKRLETPTLVLFGAADASLPPDLMRILLRNMADHVDDVEIVFVEGAAHYIPEEKPAEVLERALAFFGR
jgi:pimeloyl-ACP methyl ester carboxylesterase